MSLVVVNASSGPTTSTLPLISSVPGLTITIKDNGSASVTNTITIQPTAGNTFESGVASYILNTPLAYITFLGNPTTLKWRVLATSYPDIPISIAPVVPSPGTLGGVTGTLTNLTVSGLTTLGNSSNTGNLGVAGITTLSTVSATNINFTGGLYSNGVIFSGGSASPNFSTISTIGQAAFYSSVQIQGALGVAGAATFASTLTAPSGFAQIAADQLPIDNSRGMCFDPSGNIYINSSDRGLIYKINPQGVFSLFVGSYQYALDLVIDGIGTNAMSILISNMCYDSYTGCIVFVTYGTVRLLNLVTAQVTTIAGNYSSSGVVTYGNTVGTGKAAQFQFIYGVCTDNAGNFYVTDNSFNNIKKVSISSPTPAADSGVVTMVAGSTSGTAANTKGYTNATGTSALFSSISGIAINSTKTLLYAADFDNNVIRQITLPGGVVTTVVGAGTGSTGVLSAGAAATTNSLTATSVQFNNPACVSVDANNNLLVGEYSGGFLRYVNLSPFYTLTLAGNGTGGGVSGVGTNSSVGGIMQISLDSYGNPWMVAIASFISQYNFKTGYLTAVYSPLRGSVKLTPYSLKNTALSTITAPVITTATLYGSGYTITNSNSTNPGGATYTYPNGVAVDSQNNVYVGDQYKIRKISPSGVVTSIYGDPSNTQNALFNGTGANAQTANVYGMCFDNSGNMYFTTTMNSSNYVVTNISRLNLTTYSVTPLVLTGQTSISNPRGIVFDGSNTLYISCQNLGKSGYIVTVNINTGACVIIAGSLNGSQSNSDNATGTSALFYNLLGICFDPAKQNLYACCNTGSIRKISLTAPYAVTTPTITGVSSSSPIFITCDPFGNLFVTLNTSVIKVVISTLVASAVNGVTYGSLQGIAIDTNHNLYVCDGTGKAVYIINSFGVTTGTTNSSVYSGVVSSSGTQDSLYASSITLMAPYVGINTANPTSALHVNGTTTITAPGGYGSLRLNTTNSESGLFIRDPSATDFTGWLLGTSPNFGSGSTQIVLGRYNAGITTGGYSTYYFASNVANFPGSFTAASKNFRIPHPVLSNTTLTHASIEGPRYDLIYRNRKQLVNGSAEVDIEKECTSNGATMTAGTFDALAMNADVFLQNNDTFDRVKGYVSSHMLFIECENSNSSASINWMVVAERHDPHVIDAAVTDASGFLILENYISTISTIDVSSINVDISTISTLELPIDVSTIITDFSTINNN